MNWIELNIIRRCIYSNKIYINSEFLVRVLRVLGRSGVGSQVFHVLVPRVKMSCELGPKSVTRKTIHETQSTYDLYTNGIHFTYKQDFILLGPNWPVPILIYLLYCTFNFTRYWVLLLLSTFVGLDLDR